MRVSFIVYQIYLLKENISEIEKITQIPTKDMIDYIRLKYHNKSILLDLKHVKLIRPNHPTNCLTLDLFKTYDGGFSGLHQIHFAFRKNARYAKYQVEVQLEDRLFSISRAFKYNKFGNLGPIMELDNLSRSLYRYYSVQFNQKKFTEKDPGKKCKNYRETTYNECDQQFILEQLREKYPVGFMPVWATNNLSSVTTFITGNKTSFYMNYERLILGALKSDCPPPCTSTEITTVFLDEKQDNFTRSRINITFSDQVSIVVTDFPKFDLAVFLSACGGSMGMWLGVGIVQAVEMVGRGLWRIKLHKKQNNFN